MLALGSNGPTKPNTRAVIAICGQSNGDGIGFASAITSVTGYMLPYYPVTLFCQIGQVNTDPIPWTYFNTGPLAPRHKFNNGQTTYGNFGPELSLGRTLDAAGSNYDIAQFTVHSALLATNWHPDSTYPTTPDPQPNLFEQFRQFITNVEATGRHLAGIVWVQGEGDAITSSPAAAYQVNLEYLIDRWRALWPNVPVVVAQLSSSNSGAYASTVRAAQVAAVAARTNVALVNVDDQVNDGLHYNANGYVVLGQRCAAAMLGLVQRQTAAIPAHPWTVDATLGKPAPQTIFEWAAMFASAGLISSGPTYLHPCQDRTVAQGGDGKVHDMSTGMLYAPLNTASVGNAASGHSLLALNFPGSSDGFQSGDNTQGDPTSTSLFWIMRMRVKTAPSATKDIGWLQSSTDLIGITMSSAGLLICYGGSATSTTSANSHVTSNSILVGIVYNRTAGSCTLYTSLEKLALTYHAATHVSPRTLGGAILGVVPALEIMSSAIFTGIEAEQLSVSSQAKALWQALGESPTWS